MQLPGRVMAGLMPLPFPPAREPSTENSESPSPVAWAARFRFPFPLGPTHAHKAAGETTVARGSCARAQREALCLTHPVR